MTGNDTEAAREAARRSNGEFGEQPKQDPGTGVLTPPLPRICAASGITAGDTVWIDGNPVTVEQVTPEPWGDVAFTFGGGKTCWLRADTEMHTVDRPIAPFDDIDWVDAPDFDDWESDQKQMDTTVRYNADGYGQVAAMFDGVGDYRFHARYYLGVLGDFDQDEKVPDGRTKGEALNQWIEDVVMNAVDDGIRDRYGWDVLSSDAADSDVRPLLVATNTEPGEVDAETAANLLWPAQARFINESDPGTNSGRDAYPYAAWIHAAVKAKQAAGEPGLPW